MKVVVREEGWVREREWEGVGEGEREGWREMVTVTWPEAMVVMVLPYRSWYLIRSN